MQANPIWDILLSNKFDPEAHQLRELWAPGVAEALSTSLNPTHDSWSLVQLWRTWSPNSRHPPFQPKPPKPSPNLSCCMLLQNLHACKLAHTAFTQSWLVRCLGPKFTLKLCQQKSHAPAFRANRQQAFVEMNVSHCEKNCKYAHWNKTSCPLSPHCNLPSCFSNLTCWTNESDYGWGGMQSSQSLAGMKQEYCQESCLLCWRVGLNPL